MAKAKKFELETPLPIVDDEDETTLAAIDEGIRDAKADRIVPAEQVRLRLPKWTSDSSTRKRRSKGEGRVLKFGTTMPIG
jgi:hypothetical protein